MLITAAQLLLSKERLFVHASVEDISFIPPSLWAKLSRQTTAPIRGNTLLKHTPPEGEEDRGREKEKDRHIS